MADGAWDGSGILPAAEMAIRDVNREDGILPEYELKLIWNNSKVSCDYHIFAGIALDTCFCLSDRGMPRFTCAWEILSFTSVHGQHLL